MIFGTVLPQDYALVIARDGQARSLSDAVMTRGGICG